MPLARAPGSSLPHRVSSSEDLDVVPSERGLICGARVHGGGWFGVQRKHVALVASLLHEIVHLRGLPNLLLHSLRVALVAGVSLWGIVGAHVAESHICGFQVTQVVAARTVSVLIKPFEVV